MKINDKKVNRWTFDLRREELIFLHEDETECVEIGVCFMNYDMYCSLPMTDKECWDELIKYYNEWMVK